MTSISTKLLRLGPDVPPSASVAHVLPKIPRSLFGIKPLTDAGLSVTLTQTGITVYKPVLHGPIDPVTGLWLLPLQQPDNAAMAAVPAFPKTALSSIFAQRTDAQRVAYYSRALGNPADSTLVLALRRGLLRTLPDIDAAMVLRHPPNSVATAKGHLDRQRQGVRSTSVPAVTVPLSPSLPHVLPVSAPVYDRTESELGFHPQLSPAQKTTNIFATVIPAHHLREATHRTHLDATGRFPVPSLSGNSYVLVAHNDDSNYIFAVAMPSRTARAYVAAFSAVVAHFSKAAHPLSVLRYRYDNESSSELEAYLRKEAKGTIEHVPPQDHRANRAERAIRTFKNHLIATLAGTDPAFPMGAWDKLLPHAVMTLNMLRSSATIAGVSAYEHIHGAYDYNLHPIAPAGTLAVVLDAPDVRATWDPHGSVGFYLGPAMHHHRCHIFYMKESHHARVSNAVSWHLHPLISDADPAVPPGLPPPTSSPLGVVDGAHDVPAAAPEQRVPAPPTATAAPDQRVPAPPAVAAAAPEQRVPAALDIQPSAPPAPRADPADAWTVVLPRSRRRRRVAAPTPADRASVTTRSGRAVRAPVNAYSALFDDCNDPLQTGAVGALVSTLPSLTPHVALAVGDVDDAGLTLKYKRLSQDPTVGHLWRAAAHTEFLKLVEVRQVMHFVSKSEIPSGRVISYYNPQCKKKSPTDLRVRGTYGGNLTDFTGNRVANTADQTTVKVLLNHCVSANRPDAQWDFSTADIVDMYLHTVLTRPEYMFIDRKDIPDETWAHFHLDNYATPAKPGAYVEVTGGIYGLPQAGIAAQEKLISVLAAHGYYQTSTPFLFTHATDKIFFTLVVDDFAIASSGGAADRLYAAIRSVYPLKVNATGSKYCGIDIAFSADRSSVALSMKGFVAHALKQLGVVHTRAEHSPEPHVPARYGSRAAQRSPVDDSPPLSAADAKRLQSIVGTFLWYARSIDGTMLGAINRLGSRQAKPTQAVMDAANHFLQYAATHPDAVLVYRKSDMVLRADADGSFHSEENARSRSAVFAFLGTQDDRFHNHPIELKSSIIPTVVTSASECEYAASFAGGQVCYPLRETLANFGWPQAPTVLTTDNKTAHGIATRSAKLKHSKAIDRRYHWIRERVDFGDFVVVWRAGVDSVADYLTKAHPASHCRAVRHLYVEPDVPVKPPSLSAMTLSSGCIIPLRGLPSSCPRSSIR